MTLTTDMNTDVVRARAAQFQIDAQLLRERIASVIVGQESIVQGVLVALFCGGHVLLEGVPGVGKTLLVRTFAQAMRMHFSRIQFTPDLMPADITGTTIVSESQTSGKREFVFQSGPIFAQIVLADEINRATPKTQSALLEAMAERSVTVGGVSHRLPEPFLVLATQNPIEQEGTYPLPEAQLDRFFFKLLSTSPTRSDLREIIDRTTGTAAQPISPTLTPEQVSEYQALVRMVAVAPHVADYAVRTVLSTHPPVANSESENPDFSTTLVRQYVRLGASPRAAQALIIAAKCKALLEGRFAAGIDDVRWAALPSLRHRLIMNFESHAEGISPDSIIRNIVDTLPTEAGGV